MARWAVQPYLTNTLKIVKIVKNRLKRKHYIAILQEKSYPNAFRTSFDFYRMK